MLLFQEDWRVVGVLKENGYQTALVGKNHAYLKPADLDFWSEYGHERIPIRRKDFLSVSQSMPVLRSRFWWDAALPGRLVLLHVLARQTSRIEDITQGLGKERREIPYSGRTGYGLIRILPNNHRGRRVQQRWYFHIVRWLSMIRSKKGEKYRILAELEDASCPNLEQDLPRIRANYIGMIRLIDIGIRARLSESPAPLRINPYSPQ